MEYFLSVLGMVFIIEALPYIVFPGKVKNIAQYIAEIPNKTLQILGIIMAFSGIAIIYIGRRLIGS